MLSNASLGVYTKGHNGGINITLPYKIVPLGVTTICAVCCRMTDVKESIVAKLQEEVK